MLLIVQEHRCGRKKLLFTSGRYEACNRSFYPLFSSFVGLMTLRRRGHYISFICNLSLEFLDCFHDIRFAPSFMPIFKFEHMHRPSKIVVLSSSSCLSFIQFLYFQDLCFILLCEALDQ